jgi:hypothetical protein
MNNVNQIEEVRWQDYTTLRNPRLFEAQARHVRKIVEETRGYDNIIYEICNEPGAFNNQTDANLPSCAEVDEWQMAIADLIRATDFDVPKRHLIASQEAFAYDPFTQSSMKSFRGFGIDVVNMHPLPNTTYGEASYDMGEFMSKQLKIRAMRDFCLATAYEPKPLNYDEDNSASQYKDFDAWTIHRKRAWTSLMSGAHYDYIDFSIINYCEAGTPDSQRHIRLWMKHLSDFIHSIDLARARPMTDVVTSVPEHVCESAFGVKGKDYCVYLADDRELDAEDYGTPIQGRVGLKLPSGDYVVSLYSPTTGLYSPVIASPGGIVSFDLPAFEHDLCIRFTAMEQT